VYVAAETIGMEKNLEAEWYTKGIKRILLILSEGNGIRWEVNHKT